MTEQKNFGPGRAESFKSSELAKFGVPHELSGLILNSIEELKTKFPSSKNFGEVFLREHEKETRGTFGKGFDRYSRPFKRIDDITIDIAYGCLECNKIIIGSPEIKTKDSFFPSDDSEVIYFCGNCKTHLYTIFLP